MRITQNYKHEQILNVFGNPLFPQLSIRPCSSNSEDSYPVEEASLIELRNKDTAIENIKPTSEAKGTHSAAVGRIDQSTKDLRTVCMAFGFPELDELLNPIGTNAADTQLMKQDEMTLYSDSLFSEGGSPTLEGRNSTESSSPPALHLDLLPQATGFHVKTELPTQAKSMWTLFSGSGDEIKQGVSSNRKRKASKSPVIGPIVPIEDPATISEWDFSEDFRAKGILSLLDQEPKPELQITTQPLSRTIAEIKEKEHAKGASTGFESKGVISESKMTSQIMSPMERNLLREAYCRINYAREWHISIFSTPGIDITMDMDLILKLFIEASNLLAKITMTNPYVVLDKALVAQGFGQYQLKSFLVTGDRNHLALAKKHFDEAENLMKQCESFPLNYDFKNRLVPAHNLLQKDINLFIEYSKNSSYGYKVGNFFPHPARRFPGHAVNPGFRQQPGQTSTISPR